MAAVSGRAPAPKPPPPESPRRDPAPAGRWPYAAPSKRLDSARRAPALWWRFTTGEEHHARNDRGHRGRRPRNGGRAGIGGRPARPERDPADLLSLSDVDLVAALQHQVQD